MRRFARAGNKVIFVNSISMGLPSITSNDFFPKIGRKLKIYARHAGTTNEGIMVVSPATLPFFGNSTARQINKRLLTTQIGRLAKKKGMTAPILWIAIPTAAQLIGKMNESLVIYQVSDKYDANSEDHKVNPETIRHLHEFAIKHADIVLYSGRKLLAEATTGLEKSYFLEQAVDFDHWSRVTDLTPPEEISAIPRPRLGYFGAIEPWLMDRELIRRASRERPEWNWVFIGNLARGTDLADLPNVHFFPPVPYDELPRYAAGFDVCLLPWETEHAFTSYGSAIKVREYLATGKPVVISPLPEYESMSDVLRIAHSRDDFIRLVEDALNETEPEKARLRQAAVRDGTWAARAEWVSRLIDESLSFKQQWYSRPTVSGDPSAAIMTTIREPLVKTKIRRVSAFVPCFNHAAFVGQTLRSIFEQARFPDELLVIDDGSDDDSVKVIENVLKDCPFPCELISRSNKGLSATLNEAFAKTSGDYFAYLGSDDLWLPEFLAARIELLESRPDAVLAHGNAYVIDATARIFESSADWRTYVNDDARHLLNRGVAPISSTVCHRRSALEKYGWNEASRLEDFEMYLYLSYEGTFAFDPRVLSAGRIHVTNASRDTEWMLEECLMAHRRVAGHLGLHESHLKSVLAKTSLEYALLFARKGQRSKALSLLLSNWASAPDVIKPFKVLGHSLLPGGLKRFRAERQKEAAVQRFGSIHTRAPEDGL